MRIRRPRTRAHWAGWLLLAAQLAGVAFARFTDARYFCWAPFDMHTHYEIDVTLNGKTLTHEEVEKRYRMPKKGFNPRSYAGVLGAVEQYEVTYGKKEPAQVVIRYRVNGKDEQVWLFPPKP